MFIQHTRLSVQHLKKNFITLAKAILFVPVKSHEQSDGFMFVIHDEFSKLRYS
jgi:hypothetical protein